ncbi:MAG: Asp-tRNA(Asn)/Glu-tRNA(Gln) amidotransferase subunit GatC [Spirochaetia bacterium]|nr:Asp-tRNA(Asn)/Glu-tRNA(Gln) amidotransferase subunit GatC [Spirochaetia bacterium]
MVITRKDVEYIAHLSRLEITEQEAEQYTKELSDILEHINRLSKLNTDNVEPTYFTMDMKNVTRSDVVKPSIDKQKVFVAAPSIENNGFKVPKII